MSQIHVNDVKPGMDLSKYVPDSHLTFIKELDKEILTMYSGKLFYKRKGLFRCNLCGKETITSMDSAVNGSVKSCGCYLKNRRYLVGERKHRLTIMSRVNENTVHCKCDCGNELDVKDVLLSRGIVTSCGCSSDCIDIKIGDKMNKLTVVDILHTGDETTLNGEKAIATKSSYKVKCDCGNEVLMYTGHFRTGKNVTCGKCYNGLPDSYITEYRNRCQRLGNIYSNISRRVYRPDSWHEFLAYKFKDIEVKFTIDEFIEYYYKNPLVDGNQFDRMNNDGSYEFSNIRLVSASENALNTIKQTSLDPNTVHLRPLTDYMFHGLIVNSVYEHSMFDRVPTPMTSPTKGVYCIFYPIVKRDTLGATLNAFVNKLNTTLEQIPKSKLSKYRFDIVNKHDKSILNNFKVWNYQYKIILKEV